MQRWMMMITRQEWRIVIVYLNIRMTRGNGDTEIGDPRDTFLVMSLPPPALTAWIFHSRWSLAPWSQVRVPTWHPLIIKTENLASVQGARAGGWTCCLKYPNLYVFDEAIGRARCPVSIVIWTNIETKSKFISGKYVYLCIIPTVQ